MATNILSGPSDGAGRPGSFMASVTDVLDRYRSTARKGGDTGAAPLSYKYGDAGEYGAHFGTGSKNVSFRNDITTRGSAAPPVGRSDLDREDAASPLSRSSALSTHSAKVLGYEDVLHSQDRQRLAEERLDKQRTTGVVPSGVWDPYGFHGDLKTTPNSQTTVLTVQNYSSVLLADEPQLLLIIILNKSLPPFPLLAHLGDVVVSLRLVGGTLCASIPPQEPGEIFVSISASPSRDTLALSDVPMVQFHMAHQDTSSGPFLSALPITIVRPPAPTRPPRLAYTVNPKRGSAMRACPASPHTKYNAYGEADLAQVMAQCAPHKTNITRVARPRGCRVDLRARTSGTATRQRKLPRDASVWKRLEALQAGGWERQLETAGWFNNKTAVKELQLALATLDVSLVNAVIPFVVRASIYHSVPSINRKSISMFHRRLFQLHPFNVSSAHLFTKSRPNGPYTIFAFSLRSEYPPQTPTLHNEFLATANLPMTYTSSLDRFETTDRLCCDPRYWKYIDGAVPCKNKAAEAFSLTTWDASSMSAPLPPLLYHILHPGCPGADPQRALELAPEVFLHWEPWPANVLTQSCATPSLHRDSQPSPVPFGMTFAPPSRSDALQGPESGGRSSTAGGTDPQSTSAGSHARKASAGSGVHNNPADQEKEDHHRETGKTKTPSTVQLAGELGRRLPIAKSESQDPFDKNTEPHRKDGAKQPSIDVKSDAPHQQTAPENTLAFTVEDSELGHSKRCDQQLPFGVTLCVGKHLYTSVTAVSNEILEFIVNDWLRWVPTRGCRGIPQHLQQPHVAQPDVPFPSLLGTGL